MDTHIRHEHAFISNYSHEEGSNEYTYQYPIQWKNYTYNKLGILVRSIELIPSARDISIKGISIQDNDKLNVDIGFQTALKTNQSLNDFNKDLKEIANERYNQIHQDNKDSPLQHNSYTFAYDCRDHTFDISIGITGNLYFHLDADADISDDFAVMLGIRDRFFERLAEYLNDASDDAYERFSQCKDLDHIEIEWIEDIVHRMPRQITFKNVWDRERVYCCSTFVDLAEQNYLGFTNTRFNPPKYYPINSHDSTFTISLYDTSGNPVELPKDKLDTLIIEAILVA